MDGTRLTPGTVVGSRWRIDGELGRGGFGEVFLTTDVSPVGLGSAAIKVLYGATSPAERDDFLREVQKIAQLRHQNLVGYLDSGLLTLDSPSGREIRPYLVTELCERSLADHLQAQPAGVIDRTAALEVLDDVCAGLAFLHGRSLIHRDIKTANVLVADRTWKVADFGLMRDLSTTGAYHRGAALMGTPLYMAPELFSTPTATAASDVYAVGVLAHVCLTGRPLHAGSGPALFHAITSSDPAVDDALDPDLAGLIRWTTAKDPAQRPSAAVLADHIRHLRSAGPVPAAPRPAVPPPSPVPQPTPSAGVMAASGPTSVVGPPPAPAASGSPSTGPTHVAAAGGSRLPLVVGIVTAAALLAAVAGWLLVRDDAGTRPAALSSADAADAFDDQEAGTADDDVSPGTTNPEITAPDVTVPDVTVPDVTAPLTASAVPDPESHLDQPLCADAGPAGVVGLTNRHEAAVDYRVHVEHLDDAGVRVSEAYETILGLRPGDEARLDVTPVEDGAARCSIVSFDVTETDPAAVDAVDAVVIDACVLDEFFGNWYDITFTVTNPTDSRADAEVGFAIVDDAGRRIDDSFTNSVFGIGPGSAVRSETSEVFWAMDNVDEPVAECVVTWVELSPSVLGG